jgi:hypothetical protein
MTKAKIIEIQKEIGTTPDAIWGEKSKAACITYLRALMLKATTAPSTDQASLTAAYGLPGEVSRHTRIDVSGLGVKYDGKDVNSITVNKAAANSLLAIITDLSKFEDGRAALARYVGVYNNRPMRGGTTPSLHARAAAIDLMPASNGLRTPWPRIATMPFSVIKVFARHGWKSAGAFWGRDAMHFERTR